MKKRYYIPSKMKWNIETITVESYRLQQIIFSAIQRAVESTSTASAEIVAVNEVGAQEEAREHFSLSRYFPDRDTYTVPSYQDRGESTEVPVQREERSENPEWLPELNQILPGKVGLITDIDRTIALIDIFGTGLLERHVRLIHADATATQFTLRYGEPGIVALYDTRRGNRLDVAAAQQALTNFSSRYQRNSLDQLRLTPSVEAPPTFWFQDPASQRGEGEGEAGHLMTTAEQRAQVHIQSDLAEVSVSGFGTVFVRFAFSKTEVSTSGTSIRIQNAKRSILNAIGQVMGEILALPPAANRAERNKQKRIRARLREALRGLSRSSPLNVYIATEPTPGELLSGQVAAFTGRIFVNLQDVGDPSRLQAAIRMPLRMLQGGIDPRSGRRIPAASQAVLQRTMLHEALHVLLVNQSSDANAIWDAQRRQLVVQGSPSAVPKFVELVRKFLIAQEEVFIYENEASLYPPVSQEKARYELFITNVERFLNRKQLTLRAVTRVIPVTQRVARRAVTWTITYQVPNGTIDLGVGDIQILDLILTIYPLQ